MDKYKEMMFQKDVAKKENNILCVNLPQEGCSR